MIYFTRNQKPHPQFKIEHRAIDWDTWTMYQAVQFPNRPGWTGVVVSPQGEVTHYIDWSDHRVHVDEMRKHLTKIYEEGKVA